MTKSEIKDENISENNELDSSKEETVDEKLKAKEEQLLRVMAEMENQRRRFEKERNEAFEFGGFNFAKESVSLLDNIERATESFKNDEKLKNNKDLDKIIDGIEVVKKDLISIFKKNNIEPINSLNKKLNPNLHQAMIEIEDDKNEPGTIIQEVQKGFMMKDRLLRPALVGVSKKSQKNKNVNNEDKKDKQNQEELTKK